MMNAVEVLELKKRLSGNEALAGISFTVPKGELFGVIGPDGSGKTTLFRILTSLLTPDAGYASVLGFDVVRDYRRIRQSVGYMPGRFSLYQDLTVKENLEFFAAVFGTSIDENYHLISGIYSQIEPFAGRRAGQLSGGMKQKLALSCALIHAPELLILDEPTTGVDPVSRNEFWEMLSRLKSAGITILVSTPYMSEATQCDRIALVQDGRLLSLGSPDQLSAQFRKPLLAVSAPSKLALLKLLRRFPHAESVYAFGENMHYTDNRDLPVPEIEHSLHEFFNEHRMHDVEIKAIQAGVEDVFMSLAKTGTA